MGADLRDPRFQSPAAVEIVDQLVRWITDTCEEKCQHGTCEQHRCVCDPAFDGDTCSLPMTNYKSFVWVSMAATIGPTLIMLMLAFVGWWLLIVATPEHPNPRYDGVPTSSSPGRFAPLMGQLGGTRL
jgi:hypothetical protein